LSVQGCGLAEAEEEGEWVACRVFRRRRAAAAVVPAGDGTAPRRTMPLSAASSASCVTDGSDQEQEVTS
jgi:hypothetical protein